MAAKHRSPDDATPAATVPRAKMPAVDKFLIRLQFVLVIVNAAAALALVYNQPGTSPSLNFLLDTGIPLPVWAAGWALVAVILTVGALGPPIQEYGHVVAFVLWAMVATGAVIGLVTATTTSPSASLMQAGLVTGMAGLHLAGLLFRRALKPTRR